MSFVFASCKDDFDYYQGSLSDGEAMVTLEASFMPFAESNLTRSLDPVGGESLKNLKDLAILVYDAKTEELVKELLEVDVDGATPVSREPGDTSDGAGVAEEETQTLSGINITLPFGRYYIIGVANLKGGTKNYLEANSKDYVTLDGLLRMRMAWDESVIARNGEMLGYFTLESDKVVPSSKTSFAPVTINSTGIKLHSWLRRCASKITIDFDGSELRENVYIYIQEARIFDVAKDCTLGSGQPLEIDETLTDYNNRVTDAANGLLSPYTSDANVLDNNNYQVISYGSGSADNWPVITKGTPKLTNLTNKKGEFATDENGVIDFHSETSPALYFYENMQGENSNPGKLPVANVQDSDKTPSGGLAYNEKDNVTCGTFIEVIAYYHSDAPGNASTGVARYRFMLGKDVVKDYNAERNYHYKLTLKFHGNANDYDWHIDYDERAGFNVPNPWYVSYLYNHDAVLPFKYVPDDKWELVDLKADIEENPWYPTGIEDDNKLTDPGVTLITGHPFGDLEATYDNPVNKQNCNGFLSLRVSTETVITDEMASGGTWNGYEAANAYKINEPYYLGKTLANSMNLSTRVIMENGKVIENPNDYPESILQKDRDREIITYQQKGDSYSFNIPLFTRSKVMVKQTGYSGNNYFVGYERVARIKLTAKVKHKTTGYTREDIGHVNVVQVRRVVNPKGVYRKSGNNEPFEVKLMSLKGDNDNEFDIITSKGPWKADIIGDANFITLNGKQEMSGSTNTPIQFTIRFNRTNTDNTVRNAIVRVRYHNLTCTHLIFVRQGYDPIELSMANETESKSPSKWSTFNMIGKDWTASDPRDEGSLFKYGNVEDPIDAINNIYQTEAGELLYNNLTYDQFEKLQEYVKSPFTEGLQIAPSNKPSGSEEDVVKTYKKWESFNPVSNGSFISGTSEISNAAKMSDFEDLYLSSNIEFGYGVLYADGATTTAVSVADAYGYYREDDIVKETGGSPKGMRGMFAYHWDGLEAGGSRYNARNVFFPIGRSGYGHRKDGKEGNGNDAGEGILRYACARGVPYPTFSNAAPVFVSIYRREGAIYWARNIAVAGSYKEWNESVGTADAYGLDINYFSYDVNAITETNISSGKDACFVRCVAE